TVDEYQTRDRGPAEDARHRGGAGPSSFELRPEFRAHEARYVRVLPVFLAWRRKPAGGKPRDRRVAQRAEPARHGACTRRHETTIVLHESLGTAHAAAPSRIQS